MHNALGNVLALVAQGQLTRAEARAVAANKWVSGAGVKADDLPVFETELIKLTEEMRIGSYAARVAKRSWPEIEQILKSPHLGFATKQEIRNHPDTKSARQAFKLATFGAHPFDVAGVARMVFRGPPTSAELEAERRSIASAMQMNFYRDWPEVASLFKTAMAQPPKPLFISVATRPAPAADPTRPGTRHQRRGTVARASPTTGKKRGKPARRPARK